MHEPNSGGSVPVEEPVISEDKVSPQNPATVIQPVVPAACIVDREPGAVQGDPVSRAVPRPGMTEFDISFAIAGFRVEILEKRIQPGQSPGRFRPAETCDQAPMTFFRCVPPSRKDRMAVVRRPGMQE